MLASSAPKTLVRPCPICDARRAQVLHAQKFVVFDGHPLGEGYNVIACHACGFVFADTRATQEEYDEFYARHSKYDAAAIATGSGASPGDRERLRQMARDIAPHALRVGGHGASILDVGCATGGLLREFKELGFENVLGLDPSPASAVWARSNGGVEIVTGSLFGAPEIAPRNVVLCSHVLEHVRDLRGAARQLAAWVRPGGLLYVEVPDAARYADFLAAPFQDFNTEHINHFALRDLHTLLAPRGLRRIAQGTKEIEAAPGVPYPALWGIWQRYATEDAENAENGAEDFGPDRGAMAQAMQNYIAASQQMLDALDARLREALVPGAPVVVWGAGQLMLKLLSEPALSAADIRFFVDGNPQHAGHALRGAPVVSPEEAARRLESEPGAGAWPIVIGSTIHHAAIARRVREELGWHNPLVALS